MPRTDLLALSLDDLATLANRGRVNEAVRDLDANGITGTLTESESGSLVAVWSDGRTSELAAGSPLRSGKCSCNPVGVCKHLVRLVLLYQKQQQADTPAPATEPWDPGTISDEVLQQHFKPAAFARIRKTYEAGILADLVRGTRPVARLQLPVANVRFVVPGDVRYTRCDCAKPAPCEHVPLAIWAFRELAQDKRSGIVTAGNAAAPVAADLLASLGEMLLELVEQGTAGAGQGWVARLTRHQNQCRDSGLIWPAEVLGEVILQQESYASHDSRFDPARLAGLLGELVLRLDAIRSETCALPQLLIRGSEVDRPVELGPGQQFWGLGCGVRIGRRGIDLASYLYEVRAGGVVAVVKEVPDSDSQRSFAALGRRIALPGRQGTTRSVSFTELGAGVLQLNGGRRTARQELFPGRSDASVSIQDRLTWEEIQPPVFVEDFRELEDRLAELPPSALRPRRLADDFHVLRVEQVRDARFDQAAHCVQAQLVDRLGRCAQLVHPWTTRGQAGAEALLARLTAERGTVRFVAGAIRRGMGGLQLAPVGLVWEEGGKRSLLQPWVEGRADESETASVAEKVREIADPLLGVLNQAQQGLGELIVLGLTRSDALAARSWREQMTQFEAYGFARLAGKVADLASALEARAHTLRWDARPAARRVLELAALTRLAEDVLV